MTRLLLAFTFALLVAGCATDSSSATAETRDKSRAKVDPEGNRVSDIPWNRPQRWEGQGQLGGAMNN